MGFECVGANGGVSYQTPVLDRLARTGLRFQNAHSQPICTPSRVQLMTGIYNDRNYIKFGFLDPQATTFAHILKKAGYATCIAGKWQLQGGIHGPKHFGFDEYCLWQLTRRPGRYPNPGLEINGEEVDYSNGEYGPDLVSDYLCDFIGRNKKGPFFAYYSMILPHWPFEPTPESPDWDPQARGVLRGVGQTKYFRDMVAYTDKMVGKIVAKLDALKIRDKTLVLFTGDNGTYTGITSRLGDVDIKGGKGRTTDNGTHVPMIASWPGVVPAGKVCEDLVDFSDILPTLADIGKAALPKQIEFDGRSFAAQLRGERGKPRSSIYCWYQRNGKRDRASEHARTVRHKLYRDGRFFDVVNDFYEQRPLKQSSLSLNQRQVQQSLQQVLASRKRFPPPAAVRAKPAAKKKKKKKPSRFLVFVGTYTQGDSKGIYLYDFELKTGRLTPLGVAEGVDNPSFLAIHPNQRFLYAVNETSTFGGKKTGAVTAFAIHRRAGKLKLLNQRPSGGGAPCHLVVDATGKNVLVANYFGGNVAVLPIADDGRLGKATSLVQHKGSSVNPARQKGPHAHSINLDAGNRFAFAADLGLDQLLVYRFDAEKGLLTPNEPAFISLDPGSGPRHFAFHPSGKFAYVINEMASTVTVLGYDAGRGRLTKKQTISTLPRGFDGRSSTAEIQVHPSGKFVYGSNRGHDSIAVFKVNQKTGELKLVEHEPTGGKTPRNFALDPTGRFLLAENQSSNAIHVFRIDPKTGELENTGHHVKTPSPVCIKMMPWKGPAK